MTKARRRVARLALQLQAACIEPVFVGCSYREMQAGLEQQLSVLTSNRRKAVRRQANRLISKMEGLKNAGDHLVPSPLQQKSPRRQTPIEYSLMQTRSWPPKSPKCSVCRMRFGFKRSWSSRAAAERVRAQQKDPGLVVYPCPAGAGFHLGHPRDTRPASAGHPATTENQPKPPHAETHLVTMLPTTLHKESHMEMNVTLGAALLLIGAGVGMRCVHTPAIAFWLAIAGGALMAVHDAATGVLWLWLTARCQGRLKKWSPR